MVTFKKIKDLYPNLYYLALRDVFPSAGVIKDNSLMDHLQIAKNYDP